MASHDHSFRPASRIAAAAAVFAVLFCGSTGIAAAADPGAPRLFGSSEKVNYDLSQFPKWTDALQRYARERALEEVPCRGACPLRRWRNFLLGLEGKDAIQQLAAVNGYVNRTAYESDRQRFGIVDHWATPAEFLGRSGDCEDYAIAKYLSLRHLGWEERSLRILVLNDENRRELHAVLIAYHGGSAYVLDNLVPIVKEHTAIRHYRPIFSINATAWFIHEGWSPLGPAAAASSTVSARPEPSPPVAGGALARARKAAPRVSGALPIAEPAGAPLAQDRAR